MRITNSMIINNMVRYLGNNMGRLDKYQQQLATGKKIRMPSDDPIVAAKALKLRTDVAEIAQYDKNTKDSLSWMEITESALNQAGDIVQRARELAVQGSSSMLTTEDTSKIAAELNQLRTQMIHLGNSTYAGRYIFSGYSTDRKLLNEDGEFEINVTTDEKINYEISIGDKVNVNITAGDLFNGGLNAAAGETGKLISDFYDFEKALNDRNFGNIQKSIESMNENLNIITRMKADLGARMNRVNFTAERLEDDNLNFTKLMSENEDVDEAQVIMNLKNEENVYRASLSGGARIIQPSLIDFLR